MHLFPIGFFGSNFLPTNISGLQLWLDANAQSYTDGQAVSTWTDTSGNNKHALQSTAAFRPTFKTNILNGKPVVRFDGGNDYLICTSFSALSGVAGRTIIIVSKREAMENKSVMTIDAGGAGTTVATYLQPYGDGHYYDTISTTLNDYTGYTYTIHGVFDTVESIYDGTQATNLAKLKIYADGLALTNGTSGGTIPSTLPTTTQYVLGSTQYNLNNSAADYFRGDIAELMIYDTALSLANRLKIQAYITQKYALPDMPGLQSIDQLIDFDGSLNVGDLLVNDATPLFTLFKGTPPYNVFETGNGADAFVATYIAAASQGFSRPFSLNGASTLGSNTKALRRSLSTGSFQEGMSIYFRDSPVGFVTCVTFGCFIKTDLDPVNVSIENWDLITFYSESGFGVAIQETLSSSTGNNFRSHGGNPTTFGPDIAITHAQWYWITSEYNTATSNITTNIYNADTHALVGTSSTATGTGGSIYALILNNTAFERDGYNIYYANMILKFDAPGTFPLLPW